MDPVHFPIFACEITDFLGTSRLKGQQLWVTDSVKQESIEYKELRMKKSRYLLRKLTHTN